MKIISARSVDVRIGLPLGEGLPLKHEFLAEARIEITEQAGHRLVGIEIHAKSLRVDDARPLVQTDYRADAEMASESNFQCHEMATLERNRCFGDARHRNGSARQDVKSGRFNFADIGRKIHGANVHSIGNRLGDEVDDECPGLAHVLERIFWCAVGSCLKAKDYERRILTEDIEE